MTDVIEGAASVPPTPPPQLKPCDWQNCDEKHPLKIDYPKKSEGNNSSSGGVLRKALFAEKKEPWEGGRYGVQTKPVLLATGKQRKKPSNGIIYLIQAHHLIPIKQFSDTSTLKHNAKLAGWDIDGPSNGMFLPEKEIDIALNHLQRHYTCHSLDYTKHVSRKLTQFETLYETACHGQMDSTYQEGLASALFRLSSQIKAKILDIRDHAIDNKTPYLAVHNDSLAAYRRALAEYKRRELIKTDL